MKFEVNISVLKDCLFHPSSHLVEKMLKRSTRRKVGTWSYVSSTARSLEAVQVVQGKGFGEGLGRYRTWPLFKTHPSIRWTGNRTRVLRNASLLFSAFDVPTIVDTVNERIMSHGYTLICRDGLNQQDYAPCHRSKSSRIGSRSILESSNDCYGFLWDASVILSEGIDLDPFPVEPLLQLSKHGRKRVKRKAEVCNSSLTRLLASHLGEPGSVSRRGRSRIFSRGSRAATTPLVRGFSRGSSVSRALSFRRCFTPTSFTLIGSRDLAVKRSPNISAHSHTNRRKGNFEPSGPGTGRLDLFMLCNSGRSVAILKPGDLSPLRFDLDSVCPLIHPARHPRLFSRMYATRTEIYLPNITPIVAEHHARIDSLPSTQQAIPDKTYLPTVSSGMIRTCENPVTRLGIEPSFPWWEVSGLTAVATAAPYIWLKHEYNYRADSNLQPPVECRRVRHACHSLVGLCMNEGVEKRTGKSRMKNGKESEAPRGNLAGHRRHRKAMERAAPHCMPGNPRAHCVTVPARAHCPGRDGRTAQPPSWLCAHRPYTDLQCGRHCANMPLYNVPGALTVVSRAASVVAVCSPEVH
ncbi:hypothetical protein PR048_010022 [Dryococelus australis]|uniref:Uncharacterized protein n=1 Tax=Dryococelus australis TaxID=614101 RepID=A0ABQ9I3F8_9NEOP|nr:hypothetical protein PR048_010022 [Dryococelus australis]